MLGIGLWEIAAIALVVVVFVKPSELPRAARAIGWVVRRIQAFSARASAEMRQLSSALERTDTDLAVGTPSDEDIHPLQTQAGEEDGEVPPGYN